MIIGVLLLLIVAMVVLQPEVVGEKLAYEKHHITFGGFRSIGTYDDHLFAVSERSVCLFTQIPDDPKIQTYYDLEPIIGGEILIGPWTHGGEVLYFATSAGFVGLEIHDSQFIKRCHYGWESKTLNEVIRGVYYYRDHLYIFAGDTGMFIFDVTDPTSPVLQQVYRNETSSIEGVIAYNEHLYVADGVAGLRVMSVGDDGSVQDLYVQPTDDWAMGIYVQDRLCFIPTWNGRVILYELPAEGNTNEQGVVLRGNITIHSLVFDMLFQDGIAYGGTNRGLWVAELATLLDTDTEESGAYHYEAESRDLRSLGIIGEKIVVLERNKGLLFIDRPATDGVEAAIPDIHGNYHDLLIVDTRLLIALPSHGILFFDLDTDTFTGELVLDAPQGFAVTDQGIIVGAYGYIHELDPTAMTITRTYSLNNLTAFRVHAQDEADRLYFSSDSNVLYTLDRSTGTVTALLELAPTMRILDFTISAQYLFLATNHGIHVYDLTTPTPAEVFSMGDEWSPDIDRFGDWVAVANGALGCVILTTDGTQNITLAAHLETPSTVTAVTITAEHLYIGCEDRLIQADIGTWTAQSGLPVAAPVQVILPYGESLYIGTSKAGLYYANPTAPQEASSTSSSLNITLTALIILIAILVTVVLLRRR